MQGRIHVLNTALWQFNEAVALLRESRGSLVEGCDIAVEIHEGLPALQAALEAMADLQKAGW